MKNWLSKIFGGQRASPPPSGDITVLRRHDYLVNALQNVVEIPSTLL